MSRCLSCGLAGKGKDGVSGPGMGANLHQSCPSLWVSELMSDPPEESKAGLVLTKLLSSMAPQ